MSRLRTPGSRARSLRAGGRTAGRARAVRSLLLPLAALGLTGTCVAGAFPGAPGGGCRDSPRQRTVDLINDARRHAGLPSLAVDVRLAEAAGRHAEDMARTGRMGHEGSDGSNPSSRVTDAGYRWVFTAENVAAGMEEPERLVEGWMGSTGHRTNIVSSRATHVGVGHAFRQGSEHGHYWAAVFAATRDEPREPDSGCHP